MANPRLFLFIFVIFSLQFQSYKLKKRVDGVLGILTLAAEWQAQTKPRSYGGHLNFIH